jgi:O-methyltransferase domain
VSELSPEQRLYDLMRGALATRALGLAADLDVAHALSSGPRPVAELALENGADADVLRRLLRALSSEGVFAEVEPGVFANTGASDLLLRAAWRDFAHLFGTVWHRAGGELDASGEASFPRIHGTDFWTWLADHPHERAAFDRAMVEGVERRAERLARFDWRDGETVVDVGGGNGSLLLALLARRPGLRGIIFDLPETVRDEAAFGDRIEFVAGSFFEHVPRGDVFVLGTILHDWPDADAAAILRTIRADAPAHARLLVLDSVVPTGNTRHGAKWQDLLMLALFGGRERDETQWRMLLAESGWKPERIDDGLIEAVCQA